MPFLSPKTWSFKEKLASADMNTYVRDNTAWLASTAPHCRATRSSAQSIPHGTTTAVTLPAESFDVGDMHSTSTDLSRIVVPTDGAGKFLVTGYARMEPAAYTRLAIYLRVNGSTIIAETMATPPSGTGAVGSLSTLVDLADADYVELAVNQNSGGSVDLSAAAVSAHWVFT